MEERDQVQNVAHWWRVVSPGRKANGFRYIANWSCLPLSCQDRPNHDCAQLESSYDINVCPIVHLGPAGLICRLRV